MSLEAIVAANTEVRSLVAKALATSLAITMLAKLQRTTANEKAEITLDRLRNSNGLEFERRLGRRVGKINYGVGRRCGKVDDFGGRLGLRLSFLKIGDFCLKLSNPSRRDANGKLWRWSFNHRRIGIVEINPPNNGIVLIDVVGADSGK